MNRVLVVTHSADERDAVLWKAVVKKYPNVDLAIPDLRTNLTDKQWIEPFATEKRAFLLPAREPFGDGHSSLWISGLQRLLTQGRYALLHAAMEPWSLIPQAFVKRIPTVVQGAESVVVDAPWQLRLRRTGLRRVLRNLAGLSAWGQTSVDAFVQAGLPSTTPRAVIPMGIPDPSIFRHTPIPKVEAGLNVLYVGRLDPEKGVLSILEALRIISRKHKIHLRILGSGPHENYLRTFAGKLSSARVTFEGQSTINHVQEAMQWTHVVIVPSLVSARWMEQWGRVPIEAILSGRPCLVSDSGELPNISPVPGTVFKTGNSADLARKLEHLTSTSQTLNKIAGLQYAAAQRFKPESLAIQLHAFWAQALPIPPSSATTSI